LCVCTFQQSVNSEENVGIPSTITHVEAEVTDFQRDQVYDIFSFIGSIREIQQLTERNELKTDFPLGHPESR